MLDFRLFMRVLQWALSLVVVAGSLYAATAPRPNVILITVDTVRADRMGFLGSKLGLTPNLDAFAQQGVVFSRAYSQVPITYPSHVTILTGTYPQFHHVNDFGVPLSRNLPDLAEILHENGYKTAAFVGSVVLDPKAGWVPGISRGFDTYDADFGAVPGDPTSRNLERPAGQVVAHALDWLKAHPIRPCFLWIHLYDPHAPYEPPEPFKQRYTSRPYDGEIAYADSALGKLFEELRARGLYDSSLIAVMSDHGEAFGEHGEHYHGIFLYDETIHVPLVFRMPAQRFAGTRVERRAELVDVTPTILEVAGIPVPKAVQGESLLAAIKAVSAGTGAKLAGDRQAYAETDYPHVDFGWSSLRALRTDKYLFVAAPRKELYDQSADPAAEHNLAGSAAAVTQTLSDKLNNFRRDTANAVKPEAVKLDPRLQQKLAALGYVSGTRAPAPPGSELSGPDPKDKIEIAADVDEALLAQGEGRVEDAARILEAALVKNPDTTVLTRALGSLWIQVPDYQKALPPLRKTVELGEATAVDHFRLGQALFETGDKESAKKEVQAAIDKSPLVDLRYVATLHSYLARIYEEAGQIPDALNEAKLSIGLDPQAYDATLLVGGLLIEQGELAKSVIYLQKASKLQPQAVDPHILLSKVYESLGRAAEATAERLEAERLQSLEQQ